MIPAQVPMPYPVPYFPGTGAHLFSRYPPPPASAGAVPGYPYPAVPGLEYDRGPETGQLMVAGTPGVSSVLVFKSMVRVTRFDGCQQGTVESTVHSCSACMHPSMLFL
jgi:hypothetical protein